MIRIFGLTFLLFTQLACTKLNLFAKKHPPQVGVFETQFEEFSKEIAFVGFLEKQNVLTLKAQGHGVIESCRVKKGDKVKLGDTLCSIRYVRDGGFFIAEAIAPTNGQILDLFAAPKGIVSDETILAVLSNDLGYVVRAEFDGQYFNQVQLNQQAKIFSAANQKLNSHILLRVTEVSPTLSFKTHSFATTLTFAEKAPRLEIKMGTMVNGSVTLPLSQQTVRMPRYSLLDESNSESAVILVVDEQQIVTKKRLKINFEERNFVGVEGLNLHERIVLNPKEVETGIPVRAILQTQF